MATIDHTKTFDTNTRSTTYCVPVPVPVQQVMQSMRDDGYSSYIGLGFVATDGSHPKQEQHEQAHAQAQHEQPQHHQQHVEGDLRHPPFSHHHEQNEVFQEYQQYNHQQSGTSIQFVRPQHVHSYSPPSLSQEQTPSLTMSTAFGISSAGGLPETTNSEEGTSATVDNQQLQAQRAQESRIKAMAILERFQQQKQARESTVSNNSSSSNNSNNGIDIETDEEALASQLGHKRRLFLESFQKNKVHRAMIRNLEYVAQQEEERMKQRLQQIQEQQTLQQQMEEHHQNILQARKQQQQQQRLNYQNATSQAGIGTQQRQRIDHHNRRQQPPERHKQRNNNDDESVALYVSNLPTDGSVTEELMTALFGSYGIIRKVHFYYNKRTRQPKGDALVIYALDELIHDHGGKDNNNKDVATRYDASELVHAVCSQMNGAELPCGTIIHVEPSDPQYTQKKKQQQREQGQQQHNNVNIPSQSLSSSHDYYGPATTASATKSSFAKHPIEGHQTQHDVQYEVQQKQQQQKSVQEESSTNDNTVNGSNGNDGDDDDDLEGFFASLED